MGSSEHIWITSYPQMEEVKKTTLKREIHPTLQFISVNNADIRWICTITTLKASVVQGRRQKQIIILIHACGHCTLSSCYSSSPLKLWVRLIHSCSTTGVTVKGLGNRHPAFSPSIGQKCQANHFHSLLSAILLLSLVEPTKSLSSNTVALLDILNVSGFP